MDGGRGAEKRRGIGVAGSVALAGGLGASAAGRRGWGGGEVGGGEVGGGRGTAGMVRGAEGAVAGVAIPADAPGVARAV